jgi:hypothetical protein
VDRAGERRLKEILSLADQGFAVLPVIVRFFRGWLRLRGRHGPAGSSLFNDLRQQGFKRLRRLRFDDDARGPQT